MFIDITFDIAKRDVEYENLVYWRERHIKFFSKEAKLLGYEFNIDM